MNQSKKKSCNFERKVLNVLIQDTNENGLRFIDISRQAKIKTATLQRILKRLIKREWVEGYDHWSMNDNKPVEESRYTLLLGKRDERRVTIKEISDEFDSGIVSLKRPVTNRLVPKKTVDRGNHYETYPQYLEDMNPRKKAKFVNTKKVIPFKGKTELLDKIMQKHTPQKQKLYRIKIYPCLFGETIIPEGTKRYWESASNSLLQTVKKENKTLRLPDVKAQSGTSTKSSVDIARTYKKHEQFCSLIMEESKRLSKLQETPVELQVVTQDKDKVRVNIKKIDVAQLSNVQKAFQNTKGKIPTEYHIFYDNTLKIIVGYVERKSPKPGPNALR